MLELKKDYEFKHSFRHISPELFVDVDPTPLTSAKLIYTTELKKDLGLELLTDDELRNWLNSEERLEGDQHISTRYAGHQFGVWAGQLGDGRAISIGEICTPNKERFEIQTKGSGLTPFSRMGDGKAVIRSSVREFLCSEAMHGLNIPTTRVLALLTGQDEVYREKIERSAIVARVFPTNIRFGHFEYCFHFQKSEALKKLINYTRETFYGAISTQEMLKEIVKRTARLMAHWQDVGFCHGVMNTDNMSIMGLTIDYGPFGFLEDTILNYVCNHSDHNGRYAYNQQPSVAMWNLERLMICFIEEVPKEELEAILNFYVPCFEEEYLKLCRKKIGLKLDQDDDYILFITLLKYMGTLNIDYTFFFRQLASYEVARPETMKTFFDYYGQRTEILGWLKQYDERLKLETLDQSERHRQMKSNNPKYVLKNYIAQEVIDDVEKDQSQKLKEWISILSHPFDEHPAYEKYSLPTSPEFKNIQVSCSS